MMPCFGKSRDPGVVGKDVGLEPVGLQFEPYQRSFTRASGGALVGVAWDSVPNSRG